MSGWRKLLERMAADPRPNGYSYDQASTVLTQLGFRLVTPHGGTHRIWRLKRPDGSSVRIGLVEKGHGTLKPYLVREMICRLRDEGLL